MNLKVSKMKILLCIFTLIFFFPFILSAQETENERISETENEVISEIEITANTGREIPNDIDAVKSAQPGDYILLPSGNRYVLTMEEIAIANGNFNWADVSGIETEVKEDGTEIRTISQAHEIRIYPGDQVVHVLKTYGAYMAFMNHIKENHHLVMYLDSSAILHESKSIDSLNNNVFRVFVQSDKVSNGSELVDILSITAYNIEGMSFAAKYSSVPGMVWGALSSTELARARVRPVQTVRPISELPVSTAVLPSYTLREIGNRTIKINETISLLEMAEGRNITAWTSSTPTAVSVDSNGNVTGLQLGNSFISINESEYISIAVVPQESFYVVPESQSSLLPSGSRTWRDTSNLREYRTEPTYRLAFRFNNKGENKGASGTNGGIDILGRGANYEWLWTTYYQGGWFYNLNGVMREMVDGYQEGENGVTLTIKPEFVYDDGIPYLQLTHYLHNTNNYPVANQRFGASADVMIHNNDYAPLILTDYGAYMTDNPDNPSLELMFICLTGDGITPADTLWLGTYDEGHLYYIYDDRRGNVYNRDSAIGFSYQNINLAPNEIKEFVVRFTLARIKE